jgi:acyl-CoA synthetase (AMP-forming)/AMP-acid ligase II
VGQRAEEIPHALFVADDRRSLSYRQFDDELIQAARATAAMGIGEGDRVAVWAPNVAEWLIAAMGASAIGGQIVALNSRFRGSEAAEAVRRSQPRLLFTTRAFLDTDYPAMLRSAYGNDLPCRIVVLDADGREGDLSWEEFLFNGDSVPEDLVRSQRDALSPDTVSDIILTSGTTGAPKGVMTSHRQNMLAWSRYSRHLGLSEGERINATLPFFHNFGLKAGFLVAAILKGACVCGSMFDPSKVLKTIERFGITYLPGTPTLFSGILGHPDLSTTDLGSLRHCLVAGSVVPVELIVQIQSLLAPEVFVGYGLSELSGGIALSPPGSDPSQIAGSAGTIVEGVEVRIVDEDGIDLPAGTPGEILARSDCIMVGYMDDPAASTEAITSDGWLRTGDIGSVDELGILRLTDRKKDMFIVGGFNAYPAEIERLLLGHPGVANVAVIGIPDERLGEVGAAFIVPEDGIDLKAEEVITWAHSHMSNYKRPRRVEIVDVLPLNSSGKVEKNVLRSEVANAGQ